MRVGIMGIEAGISSSRLWVGERQWKTIEPIDRRAITGVNGIECEFGLRHGGYHLPEIASEDQLFLLLSICSNNLLNDKACPFIYDKSRKTFPHRPGAEHCWFIGSWNKAG